MSIVTNKINPYPRLLAHLVASGVFRSSPFTVIDAGARNGFEKHWDLFGDQINLVGFELDTQEYDRLNRLDQGQNRKYFPVALGGINGNRTFYVQRHVASSSFYRSREDFLQRFPASHDLVPYATEEIPTVGLDTFVFTNKIKPDFLKLDIEGAELDVFRGGIECLRNSVFGISTEAVFYPWREGIPTFSELDSFLRGLGFVLYDLPIFRWEKKTLSPYMHTEKGVFGPTDRGQVVWTQAIYLRDPIPELRNGLIKNWPAVRILKLASVMELYNLEDCAIELIQVAAERGVLEDYDVEHLVNLTTPLLGGKVVSYLEYVEYIKKEGPPVYKDGKKISGA